jgi:hypothetical protein
MKENKLKEQLQAMFDIFMTLFYLGAGTYFLLAKKLSLTQNPTYGRFFLILVGSTFIINGIYRGYKTYLKIVELFFSRGEAKKNQMHKF